MTTVMVIGEILRGGGDGATELSGLAFNGSAGLVLVKPKLICMCE